MGDAEPLMGGQLAGLGGASHAELVTMWARGSGMIYSPDPWHCAEKGILADRGPVRGSLM